MKTNTKQLGMTIDLNRCIGCNTCIVACRNFHELVDLTETIPNPMPYYLRVENRRLGTFPNIAVDTWVVPCQHCSDPECVAACPEGAISKDPHTGIVCIDAETCTGCNAIPGAFGIEKSKTSPCMVECPTHINVHPPETWHRWAEENGFRVLRQFGDGLWDVPYLPLLPESIQFALFGFPSLIQVLTGTTLIPTSLGVNTITIARKE